MATYIPIVTPLRDLTYNNTDTPSQLNRRGLVFVFAQEVIIQDSYIMNFHYHKRDEDPLDKILCVIPNTEDTEGEGEHGVETIDRRLLGAGGIDASRPPMDTPIQVSCR